METANNSITRPLLRISQIGYDADNRLATFNSNPVFHDSDGNMTVGPLLDDTLKTYSYNARNQLKSIAGTTYAYDAEGNRISSTVGSATTSYAIDPNTGLSKVLIRTKPSGEKTYYVYGMGLVYEVDESENTHSYHYDYRGSTRFITDDSANVTDSVEYSPYGLITHRTGSTDTPFLYNGAFGVMAEANGLYHMRARFYNPYTRRFVNPDPISFAGGMNWYAYANGNPVISLDPFGLWTWTQTFGVARAIGGGLEAAAGIGLGVATSWTGIGAVAGGAVALHGIDQFQAGIRQAWTGNEVDSLTSSGLQAAGLSQDTANIIDAGISVVGSFGAGTATAGIRTAQIAATDPLAKSLTQAQILRQWDIGSKAMNTADYLALGGQNTSALAKYNFIQAGTNASGAAYSLTTTPLQSFGKSFQLIGTGLTPRGYLGAGAVGGLLGGAQAFK